MASEREPAAVVAERCARTQELFRDANERIEAKAHQFGFQQGVPFICECPDRDCRAFLHLGLVEYEVVRTLAEWFLVLPSHAVTHVDGVHIADYVRRNDRFCVMEKIGLAGEIARELDPRA